MATFKEVATGYVSRIRAAQEQEAERIAVDIDRLYHIENGRYLTDAEKLDIVNEMRKILYPEPQQKPFVGWHVAPEEGFTNLGEADARAHLSIVKAIKELLK